MFIIVVAALLLFPITLIAMSLNYYSIRIQKEGFKPEPPVISVTKPEPITVTAPEPIAASNPETAEITAPEPAAVENPELIATENPKLTAIAEPESTDEPNPGPLPDDQGADPENREQ
jgi:hypothetical protein